MLGVRTVADVDELPEGAADLVFVCTPAAANPDLLRACAAKGVRAAFVASAGYGEAGDEGVGAEAELVALADELGHAARRAERPGRGVDPGSPVRADRGAVPAAGPHRGRQPVRQLRLVASELRRADGRRRQPGGVAPATPPR